eukprot:TRINITY_DN12046_c0_g1_i3.p1 TRINITY_DN12046_c0_g1~~TRINITY_DN12046_c0_g1_i3.p1  ORF type:complete len:1429 (-),score=147.43 TRINITY_DN12046_c0_g1_i3:274-4518(-)
MSTKYSSCRQGSARFRDAVIAKQVSNGQIRLNEVLTLERQRGQRRGGTLLSALERAAELEAQKDAAATSAAMRLLGPVMDDTRLNRALESLAEGYRRLARPERVARNWTPDRWAMVTQFLARMRGLAVFANWTLTPPAKHLSNNPRTLAETGIDDPALAAAAVDAAEAMVDTRILRIATSLIVHRRDRAMTDAAKLWLSNDVHVSSRLCVSHFRGVALAVARLVEESEPRQLALQLMEDAYAVFAATMANLRQLVCHEVHTALSNMQAPLESAAMSAGCLSGLDNHSGGGSAFLPIHQGVLLTNIASFAESNLPPMPEGLPVEFTCAQLDFMKKAVRSQEPRVDGALQLLRDTLRYYARVADALSGAYGEESILRASPAKVQEHGSLLSLVGHLRTLWRESGAVMVSTRQEDLIALEGVRLRHRALVNRALREGGHEAAAVVLARLALVDEMFDDPQERKLTGEVSWDIQRAYSIVESVLKNLTNGQPMNETRRRRWLYCPHSTTYCVLGGEIWQQALSNFSSVEVVFDSLMQCSSNPLSLREFRIACCLMEVSISERVASQMYEACCDIGDASEASLRMLYDLVMDYGPKGAGVQGSSIPNTSTAVKNDAVEADDANNKTSANGARAGASRSASKRSNAPDASGRPQSGTASSQQRIDASKATQGVGVGKPPKATQAPRTVCRRCLACDMPNFPHASIGELFRRYPPPDTRSLTSSSQGAEGSGKPQRDVESKQTHGAVGSSHGKAAAEQEYGEDIVIAWATSVLASMIFLGNDERGTYFRWLASIVLYTSPPDEDGPVPRRTSVPSSRATGFYGALMGALPQLEGTSARPVSALGRCSTHTPVRGRRSHDATAGMSPTSDYVDQHESAFAELKSGLAEMQGETSVDDLEQKRAGELNLPESVLKNIRGDLGLAVRKEVKQDDADDTCVRGGRGGSSKAIGDSGISDAEQAQRLARATKMRSALKVLSVPEVEVERLTQELSTKAQQSHPKGLLVFGSAAHIANSIVLSTAKDVEQAVSPSGASTGAKGSRKVTVAPSALQLARSVMETSYFHASACYARAGYDKDCNQIAAALHQLEAVLYKHMPPVSGVSEVPANDSAKRQASSAIADCGTTCSFEEEEELPGELTSQVAPLLLPPDQANSILENLRHQEELAAAAQAEAAAAMSQPIGAPRRSSVPGMALPSVRVLSLGSQRSSTTSSDSSSVITGRSLSPTSHNAAARVGPASSKSTSSLNSMCNPALSKPRTPTSAPLRSSGTPNDVPASEELSEAACSPSSEHTMNITRGPPPAVGLHRVSVASSPQQPRADLSDWPPCVKHLLGTVAMRGERMRGTVSSESFGISPARTRRCRSTMALHFGAGSQDLSVFSGDGQYEMAGRAPSTVVDWTNWRPCNSRQKSQGSSPALPIYGRKYF